MPSSKTDTAVRFPENADQTRRIRNVTQDRKAASRMQNEARSSKNEAEDPNNWGPEQSLGSSIDESAHPVPDPVSYRVGENAKNKQAQGEEADVFEAMTQDFD